jgi:3-oxoacyl-[acyl-carrier protein] reductase
MSALVVGGDGAIGSAVVKKLQSRGRSVVSLDRASGVDAADPDAVRHFVASLAAPPVNVVHVAGTVGHGGLLSTDLDEWQGTLSDNLTSSYVVCREVVPQLVAGGGGSIVLMSSVNGRHGGNALSGPAYAAAKAGVIALGRNIAKEFGPQGVRVNIVAPGPVASAMTERLAPEVLDELVATVPAGRLATPEEIASTIVHLLEEATYVNGAVVDINGGMWMG